MIIFDGFCRIVESMLSTDYFYEHKLSVMTKEALRWKYSSYKTPVYPHFCETLFPHPKKVPLQGLLLPMGQKDVEQMDYV